ncbi:FIST N-terminal domain-containing protein [Actinoplanes sp. NEAU-A12]|uniref:FIST N-terminal domain-containing protein n=1 Tax=Actinoplanes sandaracinus TaxID=3045177 RepID=A0ABT6WXC3_9ACTN|nr:FIST N-terminal domain-containing protein [Actinoplanes sandaracinus]MDI6104395.1 FIST N-terminal domain-containing protein [Actinoplanes sandaracinus]
MGAAGERWFGVGRSLAADPAEAGAQACREALGGRRAGLLVVFASLSHATRGMAEAVHAEAGGDVLMIGCTTSGEFTTDGRGSGVVVNALGGYAASVRAVPHDSVDLYEAGVIAASSLDDIDAEHRVVLLLGDGRSSDQQEMVRGAYSVAGAQVPLVGGCAGDDATQTGTWAFFSSGTDVQVLPNAVLGAPEPFGIGAAHGWRRTGEPMVVSRSESGTIHELDGEPALDVYLRRTGGAPGLAADPAAFLRFAAVRPLGLARRTGEDIRIVFAADPVERSLSGLADTPEGAMVWLMEADDDEVVDATATAAVAAVSAVSAPLGVLVFDCCVRPIALGSDGIDLAVSRLRDALKPIPYGGFYSNGEIVRKPQAKGMHHLTVVALAVG